MVRGRIGRRKVFYRPVRKVGLTLQDDITQECHAAGKDPGIAYGSIREDIFV